MNVKLTVSYKPVRSFALFDKIYFNSRKFSKPVNNKPQVAHYYQKFGRPIKIQVGDIQYISKNEVKCLLLIK